MNCTFVTRIEILFLDPLPLKNIHEIVLYTGKCAHAHSIQHFKGYGICDNIPNSMLFRRESKEIEISETQFLDEPVKCRHH